MYKIINLTWKFLSYWTLLCAANFVQIRVYNQSCGFMPVLSHLFYLSQPVRNFRTGKY